MLQVRYLTAGRGVDEGMENDDARRDVTFPCLGNKRLRELLGYAARIISKHGFRRNVYDPELVTLKMIEVQCA